MIHLTKDAAQQFKDIFKERELSESSAVRFTVKGGGCSGFMLDVSLEPPRRYDMARRTDSKFISEDIRILADKKSLLFLDGMTVRYEKQPFGHKFTYDNPNAQGVCGCGESFSV
jgi:iron-sulfur cluster assembly accessory protein